MDKRKDQPENACAYHPEEEGRYFCSKYGRHLCLSCARCVDAKLYCKFRTRCIIWEMARYDRLD